MTNSITNSQDLLKRLKSHICGHHSKQDLRLLVFLLAGLTSLNVSAATRVTPVNETMQVKGNGCEVTVYQTQLSALQNGEIKEICKIEGSLSGTSKNSAKKAIKKNAGEACGCGADKVYVMSRLEADETSAHVVMVAFKYMNEYDASPQEVDPYEAIKRKKSTKQVSSNSKPANTGRVFLDDYDRVPFTVSKPHSTKMLWLGQKDTSD